MPPDPSDPDTPFAALDMTDHVRMARHEALLHLYRELSLEELLVDLGVLAQFAGFRARHQQVKSAVLQVAQQLHAEGATHDCTEWCQLCGRRR